MTFFGHHWCYFSLLPPSPSILSSLPCSELFIFPSSSCFLLGSFQEFHLSTTPTMILCVS